MKEKIHPTQQKIVNVLKKGLEGLSLRDIAEEIGVNSPNTVLHHIRQLEKKGFLRRNPLNPSDYSLLKDPVKDIVYVNLYGSAECGPQGLLAEENVIDRIPLSTKMFGVSEEVFLVKARGDSMEPMIYDRDLVLAVSQADVEKWEIAVVVHNGEPKIKKILKFDGRVILQSLNSRYNAIEVQEDDHFSITGKVKSVIRFMD